MRESEGRIKREFNKPILNTRYYGNEEHDKPMDMGSRAPEP